MDHQMFVQASIYNMTEEKLGNCYEIYLVKKIKRTQDPFSSEGDLIVTDSKKVEHLNKNFARFTKTAKKTDLDQALKKILQEEEKRAITLLKKNAEEMMVKRRLYWWLETNGINTHLKLDLKYSVHTESSWRFFKETANNSHFHRSITGLWSSLASLFQKVQNLSIKSNIYTWIKSDRHIQTKLNIALSSKETQEKDLPQGSSLMCTLFLVSLNDVSDILNSEKALFAEDLVIWHTSNFNIIIQMRLQDDLNLKITALKVENQYYLISPHNIYLES